MAGISDEKLQELRDRVDLVAVVGKRVPLKKVGRSFRGLCPFHGEKTPSFYVSPERRGYHCFGCGASGDAIKFIMELDGKSFREAVEGLAAEAGVALSPSDPEEERRLRRRAALAEVNEKACLFYERVLWEHSRGNVAREHLSARGILEKTARAWRLGYAPPLWDALAKSLARGKVDERLVEEAGLGVRRKKALGLYDRFRGRLMIPIREGGRILAFGGRLLEGESEAKYLNSPQTPLYDKGHVLFGLDRAREAIRREGAAVVVEGYFDAVGLHQAGIESAIATCGTAVTETHLELLARAQAKELIFVFDGDAAGLRAAQRAAEVAAASGVGARVLVPPQGEDPDETVRRVGPKAFRAMLDSAQPALEFLLDRALEKLGERATVEDRVRTVEAVAGIVRAAPSSLAKDLYLEKVAARIGAPLDAVRLAVERPGAGSGSGLRSRSGSTSGSRSGSATESRSGSPPRLAAKLELQIVAQMLDSPELCRLVETSGAAARFTVVALRELAEKAFSMGRAGILDPSALVGAAEPDRLRAALLRERSEVGSGRGEPDSERRALLLKLKKHEQLAAMEALARRKRSASPAVSRVPFE